VIHLIEVVKVATLFFFYKFKNTLCVFYNVNNFLEKIS